MEESSNSVLKLVPGKSDQEIATELRQDFLEKSKPLLDLFGRAKSQGFDITFAFGIDAFGQGIIQQLAILKVFMK
jgi:hypothetical protein